MRILISNDDGYRSTGLRVLARQLEHCDEIAVVAPDLDRSGASNSLTLAIPVRVQRSENGFIRIGPAGPEQDAGPGTDLRALRNGYVSVSPLRVDLRRHSAPGPLTSWLAGCS